MPLDTKSFDLFRSLPLSPERMFNVLTQAKYRDAWNGPDADTPVETVSSDLRVGGEDLQRCGPADAPAFEVTTKWYHLAAPERVVYTETLFFGGEAACTSLVTYNLMPEGTGTALGITVAVSSFTGPETLPEVQQGWEGGLENLSRYCAQLAADA